MSVPLVGEGEVGLRRELFHGAQYRGLGKLCRGMRGGHL